MPWTYFYSTCALLDPSRKKLITYQCFYSSAPAPGCCNPPVSKLPALLHHMQDVGLAAGSSQTWQEQDGGAGGRVGVREAVFVIKPVQRYLTSIWCSDELTATHTYALVYITENKSATQKFHHRFFFFHCEHLNLICL